MGFSSSLLISHYDGALGLFSQIIDIFPGSKVMGWKIVFISCSSVGAHGYPLSVFNSLFRSNTYIDISSFLHFLGKFTKHFGIRGGYSALAQARVPYFG